MRSHKEQLMNTINSTTITHNNSQVTSFTQYEKTTSGESDIRRRLREIAEDYSDGPFMAIVVKHRRLLKEYLKE